MKHDPETLKQVEVGSVVQISPEKGAEAFQSAFLGALAKVDEVRSWGVVCGVIWSGGYYRVRLAWEHIEPTGGKAVWDEAGKRLRETALPLKHHP